MAEIDELLANAEEIDYLADDIQFLIDENLRTVTIPSDGVVLGVEGDKNSNRVNFQMPRYYNGFDMSEFTVRVNYVNANGDPGVYTVKDLEVRDDMILFTWLVDSDACAYVGVVRFLVRMTITNGSELIQAFDTTIAKANVLEGLPITNIVDEEDKYDIVLHLMGEVDEYIEKRVGNIDALEMVGKSTTDVEFANGEVGQNGAEIFNDYEKNVAVGSYSHAEGGETTATSQYAHAEGHQTTAFGVASHAEGEDCYAEGNMSHAEGWGSSTTGAGSHAEGFQSVASGSYSHAEGYEAKAENTASHAEGMSTTASGEYSHAEGNTTVASGENSHAEGSSTVASGWASHAEGENATASGQDAHAEGYYTTASGQQSHAEGYYSKATNAYSHAEGYKTESKGYASHAEGYKTIAANVQGQHAMGSYNIEDTAGKYAFIIGNGDADDNRSNALAIDWDGKIYVGDATEGVDVSDLGGSGGVGQNTEGVTFTIGSSSYSGTKTAEIFNDYTNNKAIGEYSHAEGTSTTAVGVGSHAEGNITEAKGKYSHAEGYYTTAEGDYSHAEGQSTTANNSYAHAEGYNTTAFANGTHAEGYKTLAGSSYAHAEGKETIASGNSSHAEGIGTIARSKAQHAQGKYNVEDNNNKYAFIIGNGESDTARSNALAIDWYGNIYVGNDTEGVNVSNSVGKTLSGEVVIDEETHLVQGCAEIFNDYDNNIAVGTFSHAEGCHTIALANYSHAEGNFSTASGTISHAEGYKTTSSGNASHAEGNNTTASGDNSHAEGRDTTAIGISSHAEGYSTQAKKNYSHSEGLHTIAGSEAQHVQGKFNVEDTSDKYAFIIGNGSIDDGNITRSNAFAIDWDGKIYVNGSDTGVDVSVIPSLIARIEALEAANGS